MNRIGRLLLAGISLCLVGVAVSYFASNERPWNLSRNEPRETAPGQVQKVRRASGENDVRPRAATSTRVLRFIDSRSHEGIQGVRVLDSSGRHTTSGADGLAQVGADGWEEAYIVHPDYSMRMLASEDLANAEASPTEVDLERLGRIVVRLDWPDATVRRPVEISLIPDPGSFYGSMRDWRRNAARTQSQIAEVLRRARTEIENDHRLTIRHPALSWFSLDFSPKITTDQDTATFKGLNPGIGYRIFVDDDHLAQFSPSFETDGVQHNLENPSLISVDDTVVPGYMPSGAIHVPNTLVGKATIELIPESTVVGRLPSPSTPIVAVLSHLAGQGMSIRRSTPIPVVVDSAGNFLISRVMPGERYDLQIAQIEPEQEVDVVRLFGRQFEVNPGRNDLGGLSSAGGGREVVIEARGLDGIPSEERDGIILTVTDFGFLRGDCVMCSVPISSVGKTRIVGIPDGTRLRGRLSPALSQRLSKLGLAVESDAPSVEIDAQESCYVLSFGAHQVHSVTLLSHVNAEAWVGAVSTDGKKLSWRITSQEFRSGFVVSIPAGDWDFIGQVQDSAHAETGLSFSRQVHVDGDADLLIESWDVGAQMRISGQAGSLASVGPSGFPYRTYRVPESGTLVVRGLLPNTRYVDLEGAEVFVTYGGGRSGDARIGVQK